MRTQFYERRLELELYQEELAQLLDVGQSCISMWDHGKRKPRGIAIKRRIEAVMGRTVGELMLPAKETAPTQNAGAAVKGRQNLGANSDANGESV
jgi:transcriptional regulator with XRE-family HTH domain